MDKIEYLQAGMKKFGEWQICKIELEVHAMAIAAAARFTQTNEELQSLLSGTVSILWTARMHGSDQPLVNHAKTKFAEIDDTLHGKNSGIIDDA